MGGRVLPVRVMKELERQLPPTIQIEHLVHSYTPNLLAMALGPESGIPNAWTAIIWAAHACQAAHYHLYLAHHDRLYYHQYSKPLKPLTGDALASWFFTSFTLHAIAAENHMAVSMLLLLKRRQPGQKLFGSPYVCKEIKSEAPGLAALLTRLMEDHNWKWVRVFRERWFHLDPVRVNELGLQWTTQFGREYWQTDREKGTLTLGFGGGDPCEVGVEEMLARGREAFRVFARQFGTYVTILDEQIRRDWQNWDPFRGMIKHKLPRRRSIQWLTRDYRHS